MEIKRVIVVRMPALAKRHLQRFRVAGLVLAFAAVPLALYAGGGWTVFEPETLISSAEVNENFTILDERIGVYEDAIAVDVTTGNVGIGTSEPKSLLHLSSTAPAWYLERPDRGADEKLWRFADNGEDFEIQTRTDTDASGQTAMVIDRTGATVVDISFPNGNVGIGTTTPDAALHVVDAAPPRVHVQSSGGYSSGVLVENTARKWDIYVAGNSEGVFAIADNTAAKTRLIIDSDGDVGIGTTSPRAALEVGPGSKDSSAIYLQRLSFPETYAFWRYDGGSVEMGTDARDNVSLVAGGKTRLFVDSGDDTGNVGIGTTTPLARLHVVGDIYATGRIDENSDLRLKTDIAPIENASEGIACLEGVTWHWRDPEASPERQMGLIAQDVEACFPEVVSTDPDGYKRISYSRLVAPLVENAKEQQQALAAQQRLITAQQLEIADMKARLARLEALMTARR